MSRELKVLPVRFSRPSFTRLVELLRPGRSRLPDEPGFGLEERFVEMSAQFEPF